MRETDEFTAAANSASRFWLKREAKKGRRRSADSLPQDGHRRREEVFRIGQPRDLARYAGGEVVENPSIGSDHGHAQHQRERETEPLTQAAVRPIEPRTVMYANPVHAPGIERQPAQEGSGHNTDRQGRDAHRLGQEDGSQDDGEVINQRRDRLVSELPMHEQDGAEDTADKEEERLEEHDPCHVYTERGLSRIEFGKENADVHGREDLSQKDGRAQDANHHRQDDGEGVLAFLLIARLAVAAEDGDEGNRCRASSDEISDHIRQLNGRVVSVGGYARAKEKGDVLYPDQAHDAREEG